MTLYELIKKHRRAKRKDVEQLNKDVEQYLSEHNASNNELSMLADVYRFMAETIEREAYKNYTREDWEKLEYAYVYKADYTEPDLMDDLLTQYERGLITWDELERLRRQWRECGHRFCLNVFKPRRKDQQFCSEDCRKREHEAVKEYERTSKLYKAGTYLPPSAYKSGREDEREKAYREYVRLYEPDKLQLLERGSGGKRDRATEERRLMSWRIDQEVEKYEKTNLKCQKFHVNYEDEEDVAFVASSK